MNSDLHTKYFSDQSPRATEVKKVILKIYHALTQYILPLELIPKETFVQTTMVIRSARLSFYLFITLFSVLDAIVFMLIIAQRYRPL